MTINELTETTKICKICNNEKQLEDFHSNPNGKFGKRAECIVCFKLKYSTHKPLPLLTKVCDSCGNEQIISEFSLNKSNKTGYKPICKICDRDKQKALKEQKPQQYKMMLLSWRSKNREKINAWYRDYCKENPHLVTLKESNRRSAKLQAIPRWVDEEAIKQIYKECSRTSKETGIPHHVDHILPLKGEFVSGLHVAENLRIITATENLKKSNTLIENLL